MPTIACSREIEWCAGHRVLGHLGKCKNLHGHAYVAEVTVQALALNELGMVIDFGILKSVYQTWIDEYFDHGFLFYYKDVEIRDLLLNTGTKYFEMQTNPTAENIAEFLGTYRPLTSQVESVGLQVTSVVVHETRKCSATWNA